VTTTASGDEQNRAVYDGDAAMAWSSRSSSHSDWAFLEIDAVLRQVRCALHGIILEIHR